MRMQRFAFTHSMLRVLPRSSSMGSGHARRSRITPRPGTCWCSSSAVAAPGPGISVGIIGVGQMGAAMLKAFIDATESTKGRISYPITVSDVDPAALQKANELVGGVTTAADNAKVALAHDVLVVATEPEDVPHVLAEISPVLANKVRVCRACLELHQCLTCVAGIHHSLILHCMTAVNAGHFDCSRHPYPGYAGASPSRHAHSAGNAEHTLRCLRNGSWLLCGGCSKSCRRRGNAGTRQGGGPHAAVELWHGCGNRRALNGRGDRSLRQRPSASTVLRQLGQ